MNKRFYDFGGHRLDTHNRRLQRGGETVALTPKEFEVLCALVENAGDVVGKDALLDAVWKDVSVAEETLMRNVSWLRKKLGSGANGEKFIETVSKHGYRFTAQVTTSDAPEIVVEEQTVQHIRIEETLSLSEPAGDLSLPDRFSLKQLQPPAAGSDKKLWLAVAFGIVAVAAVAFAFSSRLLRQSESKAILVNRVSPFSGLSGREDMPAFSPDGKQLVFAWNGGEDGDNFDIYVKIIGAGEPVRLTSDGRDDVYPKFSPDNRFIAFVRNLKEGGEIILIPSLGGAERRICGLFSGNYSLSFSPDGQSLAVIDADAGGANQYAVHTVNLQTGEKRRVTAPAEFTGETTPRFSPTGELIAFVRIAPDANQDLFVVPAAGGAARQLTFDRQVIHNLAWDADGRNIIFNSLGGNNVTGLWRIAATGGEPEVIATGSRTMTNLTVSPDGKTIAFVELENLKASIWRVASDAPPHKFIRSGRADQTPQFSPDGKRIVFMSDRTGAYEIWLADANGKNQRQLTFAGNQASSPRFSPDGKSIVYYAHNEQRSDLFTVSTEVGEPRLLADAAERKLYPSWSANGEWIYFTSNRTGDWQLWKMPADASREAVQITRQGALFAQPAPDGKTIYYVRENFDGLWRVPVDGGGEMPVAELAEAGLGNSWTVTSAGIYFIARAEQPPYKTKFYDFATGQAKEIPGANKLPPRLFAGFTATADGKTILYALFDENASSIMLAEIN